MRAKSMISILFFAMTFTLLVPAFANNAGPIPVETPKEVLATQIKTRLIEIQKMDKSEMTKAEKKELKKEVKELRAQAKSQGVYLSVGAIIIIILLLILIL
ncbi:MAG: hypothetical protein ABIN48_02505 [Ginsengibacter sp.]